jgi:hypothetical protein
MIVSGDDGITLAKLVAIGYECDRYFTATDSAARYPA